MIVERGERSWTVPGSSRLDEIERGVGVELPAGEYDTVAGLMLDRLGHFPEPGEQVEVDGHTLSVVQMDGLRIVELVLDVGDSVPDQQLTSGGGDEAEDPA